MSTKQVVPRATANRDIELAIDHYLLEGSTSAALAFIDELEKAYRHIAAAPASGSARFAHDLHLEGLRFWSLRRYPHLVFYVEYADYIDVWRVLHGERDIPETLRS